MTHFLHTADWQIGRQYGQFETDDAAMLAEARFDVVARIAALAVERRVDAVLVAGDVFDTQGVSDRTIRRLFAAMAAYTGPWVMIAGNHDAALADSVWSRAAQLGCIPSNVHVPVGTGVVDLPAIRLAVLAAPLTQRHTYDDVTQAFDALETEPGRIRVGLAHGSVAGRLPDNIDAAIPSRRTARARRRLDYLALGDWHGCLSIDGAHLVCRHAGAGPLPRQRAGPRAGRAHRGARRGAGGGAADHGQDHRWSAWSEPLSLPSDAQVAERMAARCAPRTVAAGRARARQHGNLGGAAAGRGPGRRAEVRALLPDLSG